MTFGQFFLILRARWLSALLVFLAIVASSVVISLMLAKQYTATASVYLDVKSPDPILGAAFGGIVGPTYMASQVDLIQSERVGRRAMQSLRLNESPELRARWREATKGQGDYEAWAIEALQKKLVVKPARDSSVIQISYSSNDAKFADTK